MNFREKIEQQALSARRGMVQSKELLTQDEFCERLGIDERRLGRMAASGGTFAIDVDGVAYFPAILADTSVDQRRLQSVCRILVPAPPACRLNYLSSRHGNLGAITPVEALADDMKYGHLRMMARAYAAEWSRTSVNVWAGHNKPEEREPTYVAAIDVDPRTALWTRALEAMEAGGYIEPPGPYPRADAATVLVIRSEAGDFNHVEDARLDLEVADGAARVCVHTRDLQKQVDYVPVVSAENIVEVVHQIVAAFRVHMKKR
ncbi:hypothetical protein [Paraburkholderia sp. GAS334]|uniref:hypothetical protein n=1 Tax=Paraburkholderia sp. GAS334 TaxID=3035131 RepID=UPI003D1E7046